MSALGSSRRLRHVLRWGLPLSILIACSLPAQAALAGFALQAQPNELPFGTLHIELMPKGGNLTVPGWLRLICVSESGQAFDLRASDVLASRPWPTQSVLTSDRPTLLWTDEAADSSSGFYAILAEEPLGWATNLQRVLNQGRASLGARGAGAAVIRSNGVLWSGVSGFDFRTNVLHPQLRFGVASVSKTFTGALILKAAEEGKLRLDDSLSRWSLNFPNITNTITLRQLLNHTSGLGDIGDGTTAAYWDAISADFNRWWTASNALGFVPLPRAQPGQTFRYSALTGFNLLGVVLEQVHGTNFAAVLNDALLRPYRVAQIDAYSDPDWTKVLGGAERAHGYAIDGTDYYDWSHTAVLSAISPSGGMYGTAEGLIRWGRLLYGGEFLNAQTRAAMMEETPGSQNAVKLGETLFADAYGLATCIYKTSHGAVFYGHAGHAIGYRVHFGHAPAINTTVAVWVNREVTLDQVLGRLFRPMLEAVQEEVPAGGSG